MNLADVIKVIADNWRIAIPAFIGSAIGSSSSFRRPNTRRMRRQLGSTLARFSDFPSDQLDAALVTAATEHHLFFILGVFGIAFVMTAAFVSFAVFRASFPSVPYWWVFWKLP